MHEQTINNCSELRTFGFNDNRADQGIDVPQSAFALHPANIFCGPGLPNGTREPRNHDK